MSEEKFQWLPNPDPLEWDHLVEHSPQGGLFSERLYLELAGVEYGHFLIKKGGRVKAGVCIVRGTGERTCLLDDFVIHNGILFLPDLNKKPVRRRFEQFELTEFAIKQLTANFDGIELALAPHFEDLRPFSWHCYHDPEPAHRFALDLRYTTYIDVSELTKAGPIEETSTFRNMDTLRQRHIRQAAKDGGKVGRGGRSSILTGYYRDLLNRQGERPSEDKLVRMERLIDGLVASGRGAIYEVLNTKGVIVYVVAYAWDTKRGYYLFGAGHPEVSEPWQGTLAHWEAFRDMAQRHAIKEVDLEGVNSPRRGWFKLGFGGDLRSYYHVRLGGPETDGR